MALGALMVALEFSVATRGSDPNTQTDWSGRSAVHHGCELALREPPGAGTTAVSRNALLHLHHRLCDCNATRDPGPALRGPNCPHPRTPLRAI